MFLTEVFGVAKGRGGAPWGLWSEALFLGVTVSIYLIP